MNPGEHHLAAERLLARAQELMMQQPYDGVAVNALLFTAHVHATLAGTGDTAGVIV